MNTVDLKLSIPAEKVKPYAMDADTTENSLHMLGINWTSQSLRDIKAFAQDALPNTITSQSISNAVQFLQHFLPEQIKVVTQARVADRLLGRDIAGSWEQEEIVATVKEGVGQARPFGDKTNMKSSDWNINFERRTIVRFEEDVEVGALEEARAAAMRINSADEKRMAAAEALAISMNDVAFNGYNSAEVRNYGILNDPYLGAYQSVTAGAAGNTWDLKSFNEIINDIKAGVAKLRVQSGSNFDPMTDAFVLGIASEKIDYLATPNALSSMSVREWIQQTYPRCRIEAVPQFNNANGGADVFYMIAETINGQKVVHQYVQDVLRMVGVERRAKGFAESYSNATAGCLVALPVGIVRYTGI